MNKITQSTAESAWKYEDLTRITLASFRDMRVTPILPKSFFSMIESASSGALLGFSGAYLRYGLSIAVVPGATIIGTITGAMAGPTRAIVKTLQSFYAAFNCNLMKINITELKIQDQEQKTLLKTQVEGWKAEDVVDLMWSTPCSEELLPNKFNNTKHYSFMQTANYMWEKISVTTLAITCAGVLLCPTVYTITKPYIPSLIAFVMGFCSSSIFITYAVPIGIALVIAMPAIQKLQHDSLMSDENYRKTDQLQTDMQISRSLHQFWTDQLMTQSDDFE